MTRGKYPSNLVPAGLRSISKRANESLVDRECAALGVLGVTTSSSDLPRVFATNLEFAI